MRETILITLYDRLIRIFYRFNEYIAGMTIRKRYSVIILVMLVVSALVYARTQSQKEDPFVERIANECASIKSMRCDFRQVRTVPLMDEPQESKGNMLYRQPDALKWSYTEPFVNSFTIDGDIISINNGDGDTEVSGEGARLFKGMAGIMLGCMTGESLRDKRLFQTSVTEQNGEWVAVLVPQRREIKRVFMQIKMVFDPATSLLKRLIMTEQSGGSTEIIVSNVSINGDYDAEW